MPTTLTHAAGDDNAGMLNRLMHASARTLAALMQWRYASCICLRLTAQLLDAGMPRVAMGAAMGDQWTNMLQSLWANLELALFGLKVPDIKVCTAVVLIWA